MYHTLSMWAGPGPLIIWIVTLVLCFSFAIIQLYAICHFISLSSLLVIRKRYPKLVLAESIAVILLLIFSMPFYSNAIFGAYDLGEFKNIWIDYPTLSPLLHVTLMIEVCRLWLMSFNLHYLHSSQNKQWKNQIDASFACKDWYLKHRNTYGSQKYVVSRVFVAYLLIATSVASAYIILYPRDLYFAADAYNGVFFSFYNCSVFYLYFKCRDYKKLNDNLYFHYEIKMTAIMWLISLISYSSGMAMNVFCYYIQKNYYLTLFGGILTIFPLFISLGCSLLRYICIRLCCLCSCF